MPNTIAGSLKHTEKKKRKSYLQEIPFIVMLIPGIAFTLVFSYLPMFGLVMAFQNFSPLRSFSGSPWVGFQNFIDMFMLPRFWSVIRNTLLIATSKIAFGLIVPLIVALQLNEVLNNKFKRLAQTVFFLPFFLS